MNNSTAVLVKLFGLNVISIKSNKNDPKDIYNLSVRGTDVSVTHRMITISSESKEKLKNVYDNCFLKIIHPDGKTEEYKLSELIPMIRMSVTPVEIYEDRYSMIYNLTDTISVILEDVKYPYIKDSAINYEYNIIICYEIGSIYRFNLKELANAFKY